jgi:hypothetical protein
MFGHDDSNSGDDAKGKLSVLEELRQMALDSMGDKLGHKMGDMKQVSVMAPDEQGLKKGLDLAKQVAAKPGDSSMGDSKLASGGDDDGDAAMDAMGGDDSDLDDLSPEEIDQMIKQLQMKKQEKMMG